MVDHFICSSPNRSSSGYPFSPVSAMLSFSRSYNHSSQCTSNGALAQWKSAWHSYREFPPNLIQNLFADGNLDSSLATSYLTSHISPQSVTSAPNVAETDQNLLHKKSVFGGSYSLLRSRLSACSALLGHPWDHHMASLGSRR